MDNAEKKAIKECLTSVEAIMLKHGCALKSDAFNTIGDAISLQIVRGVKEFLESQGLPGLFEAIQSKEG